MEVIDALSAYSPKWKHFYLHSLQVPSPWTSHPAKPKGSRNLNKLLYPPECDSHPPGRFLWAGILVEYLAMHSIGLLGLLLQGDYSMKTCFRDYELIVLSPFAK